MCDCDLEQPSVFEETRRKARKQYKCNSCGGRIDAGEQYIATFGVWDGDAQRFKRCIDCDQLMAWAHEQDDCICINVSSVMSDLRDHFHDRGEAPLIAAFEARRKAIQEKRCTPIAA